MSEPIVEVRMLRALRQAEADVQQLSTMRPAWALGLAAAVHTVDAHDLALLWIQKLVAVARAREELAGIAAPDDALDSPADVGGT